MSDNDAGLSIIYKGGYVSDLAICIDPTDRFYGWLLARNPLDGRWVSLTKIGANATTLYGARNRIAELEAELAAERERREAAEAELRNIANAKPSEWGEDVRDQFRPWAQSRARAHFSRYEKEPT